MFKTIVNKSYNYLTGANSLNNQSVNRGMAIIHAGKLKKPLPSIVPSSNKDGVLPQTDASGQHKVIFVEICPSTQCHVRNCSIDNNCEKSVLNVSTMEVAGNMTHKIPSAKKGVLLDDVDANGNPMAQYMVSENTCIPVDVTGIRH